jgi:CMP-N-acetylneuraminic acid synthetase
MNILGIIPARGGSKGVPRKNIRLLNGVPLIGHIHRTATKVARITDLILSTDDEEIAEVGRALDMDVPFLRPAELATDLATTLGAIRHAVTEMEKTRQTAYDVIVLLQPPCPLTRRHHIENAIDMLLAEDLDSVGSATPLDDTHPAFALEKRGDRFERLFPDFEGMTSRHHLKPLYRACGNVYAYRRHNPMDHNRLMGGDVGYVEIEKQYTVNINDEIDWTIAEALVAKYGHEAEDG